MHFVFPLLLGGLILVSIPVLIHLIMRQKPKLMKFPAFRFLVQRHRTNQRKLQLRHLLLLTLRILLLALICLALARPKIFSEQLNLSADHPVAAVLVFDTSYSMEYRITGGQTRLDEAKSRGLELLDQLPEGSLVAVLDTAEPVVSDQREWLQSLGQARQRINSLRLRYDSGPLTDRILDAYRLFSLSANSDLEKLKTLPRFLGVFTDATAGCWNKEQVKEILQVSDTLQPGLPRLRVVLSKIPARIEFYQNLRSVLPPPAGQDYPEQTLMELLKKFSEQVSSATEGENLEPSLKEIVTELRVKSRDFLRQIQQTKLEETTSEVLDARKKLMQHLSDSLRELSGVSAVLINVGLENPIDIGIIDVQFPMLQDLGNNSQQTFSIEDKFIIRATVKATGKNLQNTLIQELGAERRTYPVEVAAGEKTIVPVEIKCKDLIPGFHQLQLRMGTADLLEFNNSWHTTFSILQPRGILILTEDVQGAVLWKAAIEARKKSRFQCTLKSVKSFEKLDAGVMGKYQAIYLFNVSDPPPILWQQLLGYVQQGGNLGIIPPGKEMRIAAYNDNPDAEKLLPAKWGPISEVKGNGVALDWQDPTIFKHSLFAPVKHWMLIGHDDFVRTPSRAQKFWSLNLNPKNTSVLLKYKSEDHEPAIVERDFNGAGGRVVLLTTTLDRFRNPIWNDYLKTDTSFCVVLPGLLTDYLAGDSEAKVFNFVVGESPPRLSLPPRLPGGALTLNGPGMLEMLAANPTGSSLQLRKLAIPGNYTVEDQSRERVGAFSLNMPARESDLSPVPEVDIQEVLGPDSVVTPQHRMNLQDALKGHLSQPLELFPWLMLGLLLLLAMENLLSNLFYRRNLQTQA